MDNNRDILTKINHESGMTVPDGFFEEFSERMIASLPQRNEAENPDAIILPTPTLWTRVRPYVYLAAMFAGIWCMLKMFTLMSSPADGNSVFDNNPILAEAVSSDAFMYDYVIDDINQFDLYDEMIEDGVQTESFDFDSVEDHQFIDPATYNQNF